MPKKKSEILKDETISKGYMEGITDIKPTQIEEQKALMDLNLNILNKTIFELIESLKEVCTILKPTNEVIKIHGDGNLPLVPLALFLAEKNAKIIENNNDLQLIINSIQT